MKLKDVTIRNFRGIRFLNMPLADLTVLIGENNTGKSTVLEAIQLVLSRGTRLRRSGQFTEYDFHLKDGHAAPQTAEPISITLHFAEEKENDWPDSVVQQLSDVIQLDGDGLNHIWLQVRATFQVESGSFVTKWAFLSSAGEELALKNAAPLNLISRFVPVFLLSALRDASREFGQRGQFWSGFLKSVQLPEEKRREIEEMLQDINTSVIGTNDGLTEVARKIADARRLVPLAADDPVALEAIPTRLFDVAGQIQVHLKSSDGAKIPLQHYGEGTQSLAVLMLFQAFAAVNLAEAYAEESTPILALEEPEAHLHPSAVRTLGSLLQDMAGQILVTSHSGDLISRVPLMSLRRLYKLDGETKLGLVSRGVFSDLELQAIDYNIRLARGHYMFSRCWLLVEGATEFHLLPLLFELMGYSQDGSSFSILEYSQVIGKGEPFIKLAKCLGIQWFLVADGDAEGNDYMQRANNHLEPGKSLADRALQLTHTTIEEEFWHNGFDGFIEKIVPERRRRRIENKDGIDAAIRTAQMIKAAIDEVGGKPAFALALANEVQRRGEASIPESIRDVIHRVVQLAGG